MPECALPLPLYPVYAGLTVEPVEAVNIGLEPIGLELAKLELIELDTTELEPVEPELVKLEPMELETIGLEPIELELVKLEFIGLEPVEPELLKLEPMELDTTELEPVEPELVKLELMELETIGLEPIELELVKLEFIGLEPVGLEPVEPELVKLEFIGLEPVGLEPVEPELVKLELMELETIGLEPIELELAGLVSRVAVTPDTFCDDVITELVLLIGIFDIKPSVGINRLELVCDGVIVCVVVINDGTKLDVVGCAISVTEDVCSGDDGRTVVELDCEMVITVEPIPTPLVTVWVFVSEVGVSTMQEKTRWLRHVTPLPQCDSAIKLFYFVSLTVLERKHV
ncbi:unnamed protein product [Didymodactylos carnosus]|uniref:Uncharacterized protein n=1 Tax=Didymodactylos carnosus TaxID=1234261 RepID=A0A8S2CV60_9BILA|nr:unnamed protein product [Didymodactylos carnosus]CAF3595664.1 unnamed protein product [Didymodactylos carnosus]